MTTTLYVSNLRCPVCTAELPDIEVEVFGKHQRATHYSPEEWPDIWVNESTVRCEQGCALDPAEIGMIEGYAIDRAVQSLEDAKDVGRYDTERERDEDY